MPKIKLTQIFSGDRAYLRIQAISLANSSVTHNSRTRILQDMGFVEVQFVELII